MPHPSPQRQSLRRHLKSSLAPAPWVSHGEWFVRGQVPIENRYSMYICVCVYVSIYIYTLNKQIYIYICICIWVNYNISLLRAMQFTLECSQMFRLGSRISMGYGSACFLYTYIYNYIYIQYTVYITVIYASGQSRTSGGRCIVPCLPAKLCLLLLIFAELQDWPNCGK